MEINGATQIFGIFGYPIGHTLSPKLHNAVFRKKGIDAVYLPFEVKPDYIGEAIEAVRSLNIRGVNVTIPHKEQAAKYVDETPDDLDRAIGAVNTIGTRDGVLQGCNTDGPGFLADLVEQFQFFPKGKTVLLLGAGGAARAIAFTLVKEECSSLIIYNRTPERAKGLANYISQFFPTGRARAVLSVEELKGADVDLLVNCTSCGLKAEDPFPISPDALRKVKYVYDVVYAPAGTKLLNEAKKRKIPAAGGGGMLIHQAALAHMFWFPKADRHSVITLMKEAWKA